MAGPVIKKRSLADGPKDKNRPTKKQRKVAAYHSSSESDDDENDSDNDGEGAPLPANLFDSDDEDLDNMIVDDGASSGGDVNSDSEFDSAQSDAEEEEEEDDDDDKKTSKSTTKATKSQQQEPQTTKPKRAIDAPESEDDSMSDADSAAAADSDGGARRNTKSKRNDPEAFAVSISKMLSSKLPASRRADPIVARSAESAAAARQVVDTALETKARKRLREQKRLAMEKGRVRDVLVPSTTRTLNIATGEVEEVVEDGAESTGQILATERRLRKVAQRGVVKLFNAVRAAQVKAHEAERAARTEGIVGVKRKQEKVTEMSRKGFLDLIASGGGGLKKGVFYVISSA
ncbi:Rrp15p-domain-containing protein [Bombardia bombarda]|uniref:Rrp15p-domain-containing protein n=1 Tax=Bombardia bombarda TaxID=252184 RepID=A0AA40CEU0_9PEZI|nr:Rrp15p-domain-containing protein [Bombardia bombarda]